MLLDVMLALPLALATQRIQPPDDPLDCRPRPHRLRSAPPPPLFSIGRFREGERVTFQVFRCPDRVHWRIERHDEALGEEWVLGSACPALVAWVEAAERLPIPAPALAPAPAPPRSATWFVLSSESLSGAARMRVTLIEREGASNPVIAWARQGEALFSQCRAEAGGAPR